MKKTARPTDAEVRARDAQVDAIVKEASLKRRTARLTDAEIRAGISIFDRFSTEQQVQIDRLVAAGNFHDEDDVIETLAAAALFTLGLDPFADGAFCRLSEVVAGANSDAYEAVTECAGNEGGRTGADWTRRQRNAERPVAMKGKAA